MNPEHNIIKTYTMGHASSILNCGLGRNQLYQLLKDNRIIQSDNTPFIEYIRKGYFQEYLKSYKTKYNTFKCHRLTLVTEEGMRWLQQFVSDKLNQGGK